MNIHFGIASAASLAVAIAAAGSSAPSSAASRTACDVLTAAQASAIVGSPVTTEGHPSPISAGSSVCVYRAGHAPVAQLGLTIAATEAVAVQMLKMQQQSGADTKNVANRQKGKIVVSGITMNGNMKQLAALLDAAVKNLPS
jgi:hypothetical protein